MILHQFFFSLLLIFLPTQLGQHFWPDWAMVLGRRVDYLSPTVYLTDIFLLLTLISWVIGRNSPIPPLKIRGGLGGVMISVLSFVFINILFASSPLVSLYTWAKVLEFFLLGLYVAKTRPTSSFIIHHLAFGILFSSLLAIVQFLHQGSIGGPLWFLGERTFTADTPGIARFTVCGFLKNGCHLLLRPYATFPHPNVLGGYLAVTAPLILWRVFILRATSLRGVEKPVSSLSERFSTPTKNFKKIFSVRSNDMFWWYLLCMTLGVIALILSFSRSAWVVFSVGCSLLVVRYWRKSKALRLIGIFSALCFIVFLFLITRSFSPTDESVMVRQQLNGSAVTLFRQSPLIGIGLGNFLIKLPTALPSRHIYFLQPVHNIYLLVLAEGGIIGFCFFLFFIWRVFSSLSKRWYSLSWHKYRFSIYHLAFSMLLFLGLVDHYPLTLQQGQLLFTLFAALAIANP